MRLDTALELSLYLSKETEIMAVTQGFGELVPLYKLMEKRDMAALENQMKVSEGSSRGTSQNMHVNKMRTNLAYWSDFNLKLIEL